MPLTDRIAAFLFRRQLRGATRFHRLVCRGRRIAAVSKHGIRLELDPGEYIDGHVLRCGFYEEEVLDAITGSLQPGDVFWDVGSNLGLHALTVARLRPGVRVWGFEPNPTMAALIKTAATRNGLPVELLQVALDSQAGTAEFYLHEGNAGRSGLHNWTHDPQLRHIVVTTATGDQVVAEALAPSPNVLKVDVEGNEARVFQGMGKLLSDRRLHTVVFEDAVDVTTGPKRILHEAGFTLQPLERREATHHNLDNFLARRDPVRSQGTV